MPACTPMTFDTLSRIAKRWAPAVSVIAGAAAVWVLWERLHSDDIGKAFSQLRRFPLSALFTALACSAGCYILVGLYEGLAVRIASGRRAVAQPFVAATIANPIGHMVAFAVLSAAALRYRLYSVVGLTAPQVAAIVVLVAMPYLLSVGWLIDIALLTGTADV